MRWHRFYHGFWVLFSAFQAFYYFAVRDMTLFGILWTILTIIWIMFLITGWNRKRWID